MLLWVLNRKNDRIEYLLLKGRGLFMAKSLASLKQRDDYQGRQIRCLIVEDLETGALSKQKDSDRFKSIIEQTSPELLTMVFEPTEAERNKILKVIAQGSQSTDGKSLTVSEEDILLLLLEMTNLEMDPQSLVANRELMKEILAKPSALFLMIKSELEIIMIEIVASFEETMKAYSQMPTELLETTTQLLELQEEERRNASKIEEKKKEIESLRKQLAELEGDMGETIQ